MQGICPMCGGGMLGMLLFWAVILVALVGLGWLIFRMSARRRH